MGPHGAAQSGSNRPPPPATLHGLVKELKRLLDIQKRPAVPWTQRYPASPQELDTGMRAAAYADEEPAGHDLAALSACTLHVPLRSTSKLLKDSPRGSAGGFPAPSGGAASLARRTEIQGRAKR